MTLTHDEVKNILKPEFIDQLELDAPNFKSHVNFFENTISTADSLSAYDSIVEWDSRYYPETLEENKTILENYLSLLDSNNIKPILFLTPRVKEYKDHFNRKILRELFTFLRELSNRYSFEFINGWTMDEFDEHDFYDIRHMNLHGVKKFTKIVNAVINKLEGNF